MLTRVLFLLATVGVFPLHAQTLTHQIRVDQFGYNPDAPKVAVIADPVEGFNADESYTPGDLLEVRRVDDGTVVFSGTPVAWNGGTVHAQSGDRVWWFDFSSVTAPGDYAIHDPANGTVSDTFTIDNAVYIDVLKHAVRMFFYQRSGFAKEAAYAGEKWADGAAFLRDNQDIACRPVGDKNNAAAARDLRGGWFDAGDYNKYTDWAARVVLELLHAWSDSPHVFADNYNIPESGNGIPDLLDEVKWQMDWLLRMQEPSGALLGKVAVTQHQSASPASADDTPRYYGPVSTEATAAGAAAFALGAQVYARVGMTAYSETLRTAALAAWAWAEINPDVRFDNTGFASADPGTDDYGRQMRRLQAAIHLFALTGEQRFHDHVLANISAAHPLQWWYFYGFEGQLQKSLVFYAQLPDADPDLVALIKERYRSSIRGDEFLTAFRSEADAYRAYMKDNDYVWGSNGIKSQVGVIFLNAHALDVDPAARDELLTAAYGFLHYLHGVNALGMVMLTNMYDHGAVHAANEMYHLWMGDGTPWDNALTSLYGPAPGYLVGGVNRAFTTDQGVVLVPPQDQPIQKAYRDWNTSWPENSWQITEPAIYYQAAYIHLLSRLIGATGYDLWAAAQNWAAVPGEARRPEADPDGDQRNNFTEYAFGGNPLAADDTGFPQLFLQDDALWFGFHAARPELNYTPTASPNLQTWGPFSAERVEAIGSWQWPLATNPENRFFRVSVSPRGQ